MRRTPPIDRSTASFGLAGWRGEPPVMSAAHSHNDVELNYLERGAIVYGFGGARVELRAGELCLFWAARPHQLWESAGALMHWLTLPLALFLSWRLPERLAQPVLAGAPITRRPPGEAAGERPPIAHWAADLALGGAERQRIVCLEVEALLRRLSLELGPPEPPGPPPAGGRRGHAEQMARHIAAHYTQPLSAAAIAASAGLHPHYAMQLFRAAYGLSLIAYLTQYRVAHAQQLLATSDAGVLEIGLASGFASASRFHSAFKAACGVSPGAYRASLQAALLRRSP